MTALLRPLRRLLDRRTLRDDLVAGVVLGVESVPDGLASGLLAGLNPLAGLYGYLYGTVGGALFTSTPFMAVQATGAMALVVADVDLAGREEPVRALATLTLLTGVAMVAAGLLGAGSLLRFVPTAVMTGFITAVGVNIVLGQLDNFTGYRSAGGNRVLQALDLLLHPLRVEPASLAVGLVTLVLIVGLRRTRLGALGMVVAVVVGSALAAVPGVARRVPLVGDLSEVPNALPLPTLPSLQDVATLALPALSLAFVGLVQGAGVSAAVPGPDGRRADVSRDFLGQGVGNIAAGFFRGMPVGGSMSASALVVAGGARSRLALLAAGGVMAVVVLLLADVVELVAMPALAALLMTVGAGAVKPVQLYAVSKSGPVQATVMLVTLVLTMVIPLQYAVLVGVAIAIVLYVVEQSNTLTVRQVLFASGRLREVSPPGVLPPRTVVVLQPYGSLFFASAPRFEAALPAVGPSTAGSVVVLRLRGVDRLGLAGVDVVKRYAERLTAARSKLVLVVSGAGMVEQLEAEGLGDLVGRDNVYRGTEWLGETVRRAHEDALGWVERRAGDP